MPALYLTPAEVAERWAMSARHVRRLCRTGALAAMQSGSDWRVPIAAVESYEAAHTNGTPIQAPAITHEEVRPAAVVDGFTLPKDYTPCFPELWNR